MKDLESKDTQSLSFRDQILRELEMGKEKRAKSLSSTDEPLEVSEVNTEAQTTEKAPLKEEVSPKDETSHPIELLIPSFSPAVPKEREQEEDGATSPTLPTIDPADTEEVDLEETRVETNWSLEPQEHPLEDTIAAPIVTTVKESPSLDSDEKLERRRRSQLHKNKQESAANRIVMTVVVIVLFALAFTGYAGYSYVKASLNPIDSTATKIIQVEIPEGSTTKEIGDILVKNKLIKNATIFNYYAKLKSYNNFQSGFYNLKQSMSVDDLAKALQESGTAAPQEPVEGKILIIEGYTIDQIAQAVTDNAQTDKKNDKTRFSAEEFLATVKNPDFIARMTAAYPSLFASLPAADSGVKYQLEGYLFPATYEYSESTTMEQLVEKMIAAMDANLQGYYEPLAAKGLTVNQLLTLASLVEKEGSTDEDRRNIASVFYNRLNIDMPLQSNIAILYAMGKLGDKTTLAEDAAIDTNIDSPYNIYVHTGLMPGAIASPSLAAIEATVNPNQTDYYYFVADVTTGTVYYSATAEEHHQNVEQYVNSKLNQ